MSEQENVNSVAPTSAEPTIATAAPVEKSSTPATTTATPAVEAAPTEEWKPDFGKLKVMDKEFDWDDDLKKVVSKDNYEKLKELQNKAYGLPFVKERYAQAKDEVKIYKDRLENEFIPLKKDVDYFNNLVQKKDLYGIFKVLNIADQDIMKYALNRADYHNLPPEKKQEIDQNMEAQSTLTLLEQQNMMLSQQIEQQAVQTRTQELDSYISRPEVAPIAQSFDARVGRPGAFREEAIKRGKLYWHTNQQDIPVNQAVSEVMSLYGAAAQPQQAILQQAPATPAATQTTTIVSKPTIPNIKASGHSPVKSVVKNLDDIRKLASTMEA